MSRRAIGVVLAPFLLAACNGSPEPAIPGLDPSQEVEVVEVEPDPGDDSFVWVQAVQVEDLPTVNVGHPTADFLEDAAREPPDPELYLCVSSGGSPECDGENPGGGTLIGMTFGRPDVMAWSWLFVPDDAAAVRFTDQDGATSWQRPFERTVIFPDTVEDPDGRCLCRLDAIGEDGDVISSVDVDSSTYIDD
jgi:hypothetical protein